MQKNTKLDVKCDYVKKIKTTFIKNMKELLN